MEISSKIRMLMHQKLVRLIATFIAAALFFVLPQTVTKAVSFSDTEPEFSSISESYPKFIQSSPANQKTVLFSEEQQTEEENDDESHHHFTETNSASLFFTSEFGNYKVYFHCSNVSDSGNIPLYILFHSWKSFLS